MQLLLESHSWTWLSERLGLFAENDELILFSFADRSILGNFDRSAGRDLLEHLLAGVL